MLNKKIYLIIFSCLGLVILTGGALYTYSLFQTDANSSATMDIAGWNIKVNNQMITNNTIVNNEVPIGNITWQNANHVRAGKAAPGSSGTFQIEIDPVDTDVSFAYTIEIDTSNLHNSEFTITSVSETNGNEFIRTGENIYTGIAHLEDIINNEKYNISINFFWNNDDANSDNDYHIGVNAQYDIIIPIRITVSQYIGTESYSTYEE